MLLKKSDIFYENCQSNLRYFRLRQGNLKSDLLLHSDSYLQKLLDKFTNTVTVALDTSIASYLLLHKGWTAKNLKSRLGGHHLDVIIDYIHERTKSVLLNDKKIF